MNTPPKLLRATSLDESDIGSFEWNAKHNADLLTVSRGGMTIEWGSRKWGHTGHYPPAWVPASTRAHLHSGTFRWDFVVDVLAKRQIGIGFMLMWHDDKHTGPDWGFFGYLGASPSAWAYDPRSGDVVVNTASIEGGLPKFEETGTVSVVLELPRTAAGSARFEVDGRTSKNIALPEEAVVLPAACLLKESQRVTLANFTRG